MGVLNAIPHSKLLLKSKNLGEQVERERIEKLFQEMGLAPERLELRGHSRSVEEHLTAYNDVDIALDTFLTPAAPQQPMLSGWAYRY